VSIPVSGLTSVSCHGRYARQCDDHVAHSEHDAERTANDLTVPESRREQHKNARKKAGRRLRLRTTQRQPVVALRTEAAGLWPAL